MIQGSVNIQRLLGSMGRLDASDLHIKVGIPPVYRVNGVLRTIESPPLTEEEADHLLDPIFTDALRERFINTGSIDFAHHTPDGDRFRINMFRSGNHTHAAIRRVKAEIPDFEQLHMPPIYRTLTEKTHEGMVIICGVTGSGKSTTLAAMIDHVNIKRGVNIITVEDPVEYRFTPKQSIISQREIGIDVPDFPTAMRYVVRQDPDVIFIGEMRDHETILAAIQAAETGHLVFATLHTADTMQSFGRLLEFFPQEERAFVRSSMANSLRAICAQRLLPALSTYDAGVVPATEVLIVNSVVKEKIRDAEDSDLPSIIAGSGGEGMHSFNQSLAKLVEKEAVDLQTAMGYAPNREALSSILKGVEVKAQTLVNRVKGAR